MTLVVFARAALVPSTARWTVAVTGFTFVAVVPTALLPVRNPSPPLAMLGSAAFIGPLATAALWWLLTVVLAGVTSSVIYGLRRDVKKAKAFGQYHLVAKIGEGGMGLVYRARHHMLRRETALKILPPARLGAGAIARFEREVQLTAQLTHANTVTIFDYGRTPDGLFYYTMELLDGATLEDIVLATGPMPAARVARVLAQVASALAEAHSLGMVHRDVKPSNIMLCKQGGELDVAKVLDFGLVRESIGVASAANLDMTAQTELLGTPLFMSPEAIASPEEVSAASDLYSLGAVAVFLLTGKPLFSAPTLVEVCSHHLHSAPPRLGPVAPEALERLVLACLAKKGADRPASARALAAQLSALGDGWTAEDASTFWEENAAEIRLRGRERLTASSLTDVGTVVSATLDVDVARRLLETSTGDGATGVLFPAGQP
jgi:eukaryotic-like serine/threonine-protein kinase